MKGNQNPPNKHVASNQLTLVKHYHFPIDHGAKVGKIETLLDTECLINLHFQTPSHTMEMITLNHQAERVHNTGDHTIFRKNNP